jgi:glycosyltransferase involved in cell wall biosynthesis
MRILIAASIYPPEIGGPSFYAASLKEALERGGHHVDVVVLSAYKKWPSGIRHALFALELFRRARGADALIAFDVHAAGLPAAIVARLRHIPAVIRVGGDFLWEHYGNRTGDFVPLTEFYARRDLWSTKERFIFKLERSVVRRAMLAFSSRWIADIWQDPYGIEAARVSVIENAIPSKLDSVAPVRKNFIFYSRQIPLKNHAAFRRAFAKAKEKYPEIELEEGMVSHAELMERMKSCYAAVVPSLSEVTPNYIIDALRCAKPFLLTKYSGYAERFKDYGVIVDPLDEADMARGIEHLADPATYAPLQERAARFNEVRTYDDIAKEFIALLQKKI